MFWDWESAEIVRRIDIEAMNVGFFQLFSFCLRRSESTISSHYYWRLFLFLQFNWDAHNVKLEGAEITDEGVEQVFEDIADVSEG